MKTRTLTRTVWIMTVAVAMAVASTVHGQVTLPFNDDFNDTIVGPWSQYNGTYTHNGATLSVVAGGGVGGASVLVPELGGSGETNSFTLTLKVDPSTANTTAGFGLLSGSSNFGAANNSYYLVDIDSASQTIRIAQINISGTGSVGLGDTGLQTEAITYSSSEVYTLTVEGTYGPGGLTLDLTVTSTGGDNDNVNLVVTDSTPLTGQYFGIETFGTQTTVFDDFSIAGEIRVALSPATVASNAAPGTLVGSLSMSSTNGTGFAYALDPGGNTTHFEIVGSTNLRTKAWMDAASYDISVIGSKGAFSVTTDIPVTVTSAPNDYLASIVAAEVSATATGGETVGVLQARATDASVISYSLTGGRTDLFEITDTTNLTVVSGAALGSVGATHYVDVQIANAVATNNMVIAVGVTSTTPTGTVFLFR